MTTDAIQPDEENDAIPAHLSYADASRVTTQRDGSDVELYGNLDRPPVKFSGRLLDPLRFREAMSALYAVVGADYRYKPKDRTAYLAYLRLKRETAGQAIWKAQQAYFSWLLRNDPLAFCILDPVVTVHPDQVQFEVFSKDESAYACLAVQRSAFETDDHEVVCGTTNIDFSEVLFAGIQRMRGYRVSRLSIQSEKVSVAVESRPEVIEKKIRVPDSWLRGFLQVQSAAALPFDQVTLAPVDLYNLLRSLRMRADIKGKRRGLRFELVPGQNPRIVAEPWETSIVSESGPYRGKQTRVIRVWGRRRLLALKRLLPFVESVEVFLLGNGLPSFWIFRAGAMTFTLGMTGFTSANWSQSLGFDLLLPRNTQAPKQVQKVLSYFQKGTWFADTASLAKGTGVKGAALQESLLAGCRDGTLMVDLAAGVYRYRPLVAGTLDLTRLEYRNVREKVAHDLVSRREAVTITGETRIPKVGLELTGQVSVAEDKRDYRPQMVLADEGQVRKAVCTCTDFRKRGLKEGPCVHLIALRIVYANREAKRSKTDDSVVFETRAFTRRQGDEETTISLSLERKKLKVRLGIPGEEPRIQSLLYNSEAEARAAYFGRLNELDAKGYLDAVAD